MPFFTKATDVGASVDSVFLFILALCTVFLAGITFLLIYFVIKYNRKRHPKGEDIEGNTWLEVIWTATPTVLFLVMFYFGWTGYGFMRNVPRNAMEITVTARQWAWAFSYPNGRKTAQLVLALDRPVKLQLQSLDVIHGFFIPAFRIKEDVVPGQTNYTWFTPKQLGQFDIECTVICGASHANMLSKVMVVPVSEFEAWYFGDSEGSVPEAPKPAGAAPADTGPGKTILDAKDCLTCHSIDGSDGLGPSFKGLYGRRETVVADGKERDITMDDAHIAAAIKNPGAEIVKGYSPLMPTTTLSEADLNEIIAYLKTLK